jgi:hypothetical protein
MHTTQGAPWVHERLFPNICSGACFFNMVLQVKSGTIVSAPFDAHLFGLGQNEISGDPMIKLPDYARIDRTLARGEHPYCALLPRVSESPAMRRIASKAILPDALLKTARVRIQAGEGYVWVDDKTPAIILIEDYYRSGNALDLYLDLLHELTHLRQLAEGHFLWDERFHYVDRPTEIEGYAVAIEEGLRMGMSKSDIIHHLSNPWMTRAHIFRLLKNVEQLLADNPKD